MPADIVSGYPGYDAAWISFTGNGYLDPGQTFSTTVLFTPPGTRNGTESPVEGVDFFAQDPSVPSNYDNFGHQVFGIYLGPNDQGETKFDVSFHTTLSDEHPAVNLAVPLPFTGTASNPQEVKIIFTQLAQGNWILKLISGDNTVVLTSQEYGATWNTTQGLDAVRYFTSQGGTNPGGPLEWKDMSVAPVPPDTKDFAGGGYADLVWENTSTGERALWLLKNGALSSTMDLPTIPAAWHIAGVGDFAGDGNADLLWENTSTGQHTIWLLKNGVRSGTMDLPTIPVDWHIAGVGDFNGDGNDDLVWENTRTGQRGIWFFKNGAFSSSIFLPTIPVAWHIAGAGDFSGNGQAGLVWQNTSTGERAIWFMKNGVLTSTANLPMVPLSWNIVVH